AKEKEGGKARETAVAQRGAASCESGPAFSPRAPQHRPLMPPALDGPATFRGRLAMSDCQEPKGPSKKRILDPDRRYGFSMRSPTADLQGPRGFPRTNDERPPGRRAAAAAAGRWSARFRGLLLLLLLLR
ncbi:unnamed protein product, partial [Prorocentrum cordatum]